MTYGEYRNRFIELFAKGKKILDQKGINYIHETEEGNGYCLGGDDALSDITLFLFCVLICLVSLTGEGERGVTYNMDEFLGTKESRAYFRWK